MNEIIGFENNAIARQWKPIHEIEPGMVLARTLTCASHNRVALKIAAGSELTSPLLTQIHIHHVECLAVQVSDELYQAEHSGYEQQLNLRQSRLTDALPLPRSLPEDARQRALHLTRSVPELARKLPAFPGVITPLLALIDDEEASLDLLGAMMKNDPVLTGSVLSTANIIRRQHGLDDSSNVFQAISFVGFNRIRNIIITVGLNEFLKGTRLSGLLEHLLAVALLSQEIAALANLSPIEAYVAGILHDIGKLMLWAEAHDEHGDLPISSDCDLCPLAQERQYFGMDHCVAGHLLAKQWHLPDAIVHAIGEHHAQLKTLSPLAAVVNLAESLSDTLSPQASDGKHKHRVNMQVLSQLNLDLHSPAMYDCYGRSKARLQYALKQFPDPDFTTEPG